MGQSNDQSQLTVLPIWNRFMGLVHQTYIESVWSQGGDCRKADSGIAEQGQADTKSLIARPRACSCGYEE